jgi:type II secretory pathway component PulJ
MKHGDARRAGGSIVEMMVVVTIFVLVATSIYSTLANVTHLHGQSDSNVALQLDGQKALNGIINDLRTTGFFRPQSDQTLNAYNPALWANEPFNDPHKTWDVPYLFGGDGVAYGTFTSLSHTPAYHSAEPSDEEYNATQEIAFVPIGQMVSTVSGTANAIVNWAPSGSVGATSRVVVPIQWNVISYELRQTGNHTNNLVRVVRSIDQANMKVGGVLSETVVAHYVEAVRFDTAQTDASLALYTVKVTLWLRRKLASGELAQAKMQARIKLRNSVGL